MTLKGVMYYLLSKLILFPLILLVVFVIGFIKSGIKAGAKHGLKAGAKSGVRASVKSGVKTSARSSKGVIRDKGVDMGGYARGAVQQGLPRGVQGNIGGQEREEINE